MPSTDATDSTQDYNKYIDKRIQGKASSGNVVKLARKGFSNIMPCADTPDSTWDYNKLTDKLIQGEESSGKAVELPRETGACNRETRHHESGLLIRNIPQLRINPQRTSRSPKFKRDESIVRNAPRIDKPRTEAGPLQKKI